MKEIEYYLGGELGAETLAEEDGVGVHEMPKTLLHAIHEYRFHGCLLLSNSISEKKKINGKKRGFWFRFKIKSNQEGFYRAKVKRFSHGTKVICIRQII